MAQNNATALHATIAARSCLCLLVGLAYAAAEMDGDEDLATRVWCDRARYVCAEFVAHVATMVLANEIEGTETVGRALQREARRLDFMWSGEAALFLAALLQTLASAVEPRKITTRSLLVAVCAVHALDAAREVAANWYERPGVAADAAVEAEPIWHAAVASGAADPTTRILAVLFDDRHVLADVMTGNSATQGGDRALRWIVEWLSARSELDGLVEGISAGFGHRAGSH